MTLRKYWDLERVNPDRLLDAIHCSLAYTLASWVQKLPRISPQAILQQATLGLLECQIRVAKNHVFGLATSLEPGGMRPGMREFMPCSLRKVDIDLKLIPRPVPVRSYLLQGTRSPLSFVVSNLCQIGWVVALCCIPLAASLGNTNNPNSGGSDTLRAVIYARVSGHAQAKTGDSLDDQVATLKEKAPDYGVGEIVDIIRDEGETGRDFDRDGILRVLQLAREGECDAVLVTGVDRLGRAHALTLFFIHMLVNVLDCRIITEDGPLEYDTWAGEVTVTFETLLAESESYKKGEQALRIRARNFLEERNWESWYRNDYPLGYGQSSDGWVKLIDESSAKAMFNYFIECESYSRTAELLNSNELSDSGTEVTRQQVGRWLCRSIYIGKPAVSIENIRNFDHQGYVDDPQLAVVDESIFDRAQEIIEEIEDRYSPSSTEKGNAIDTVFEVYHWFSVAEVSPIVELKCPYCGANLVQNGEYNLRGDVDSHMYLCQNKSCGRKRAWPKQDEIEKLEVIERLQTNPRYRRQVFGSE